MGQLLLTIPDDNISMFLDFVKNLEFIQKVEDVKDGFKPLTKKDWAKPGRPATDEEFEKMIVEAEKSESLSLAEAKNLTNDSFRELGETKGRANPEVPINWALPGRPATDEEFEQMIAEAEAEEKAGLGMSAAESEAYVTKRIKEWEMNRK